jgi:NAD(P)-dependent dehydrogenase (short-subunit alcohol dehydrogenase family)
VNAIRPGIIETDIHATGGQPDKPKEMASSIPMKRTGQVEEVADAIVYLLSPSASYITGAILNVSGGR